MKTKIKYCLMGGLIAASLTGFNSCQLESEIYDSKCPFFFFLRWSLGNL